MGALSQKKNHNVQKVSTSSIWKGLDALTSPTLHATDAFPSPVLALGGNRRAQNDGHLL